MPVQKRSGSARVHISKYARLAIHIYLLARPAAVHIYGNVYFSIKSSGRCKTKYLLLSLSQNRSQTDSCSDKQQLKHQKNTTASPSSLSLHSRDNKSFRAIHFVHTWRMTRYSRDTRNKNDIYSKMSGGGRYSSDRHGFSNSYGNSNTYYGTDDYFSTSDRACELCKNGVADLNRHVSDYKTCADVLLEVRNVRYDSATCSANRSSYNTCCASAKSESKRSTLVIVIGLFLFWLYTKKIRSRQKKSAPDDDDDDSDFGDKDYVKMEDGSQPRGRIPGRLPIENRGRSKSRDRLDSKSRNRSKSRDRKRSKSRERKRSKSRDSKKSQVKDDITIDITIDNTTITQVV